MEIIQCSNSLYPIHHVDPLAFKNEWYAQRECGGLTKNFFFCLLRCIRIILAARRTDGRAWKYKFLLIVTGWWVYALLLNKSSADIILYVRCVEQQRCIEIYHFIAITCLLSLFLFLSSSFCFFLFFFWNISVRV